MLMMMVMMMLMMMMLLSIIIYNKNALTSVSNPGRRQASCGPKTSSHEPAWGGGKPTAVQRPATASLPNPIHHHLGRAYQIESAASLHLYLLLRAQNRLNAYINITMFT